MAQLDDDILTLSLPGIALRQARVAGGLSLDELAAKTCIPLRYLTALEADDYARLPAPVYVRGYLCRCAAELDGDAERWMADFDLQYQERCGSGDCRGGGTRTRAWPPSPGLVGGAIGGLLLVVASLVAVSLTVWWR